MSFARIFLSFIALLFGVYFYVNVQQQKILSLDTTTHSIIQYFLVNSYLYRIPSTNKYILVDTLMNGSQETILKKLKDLGISIDDIALVYHTHYHDDHTGSTIQLSKVLKSKFWIHPKDQEFLDNEALIAMPKSTLRPVEFIRPYIPKQPLPKIKSNVELKLNEKLKDFGDVKIVHIPGHTEFHTALITPTGDCFIGDLLSGSVLNLNQPDLPWFYERTQEECKDTAKKLLKEESSCKIYYVGHGLPFSRESLEQFLTE